MGSLDLYASNSAPRKLNFIRPRESGGGGPCEAWWRGRLNRSFAFFAGESLRPAPLPPPLGRAPPPVFTGEDKSLHRRQIERLIDQRAGALEVENAIKSLLRHKRRPAVEFFV